MRLRSFLVLAGVALLAWPGWAGDRVVAVSPGSPAGAVIEDTCPTFSWGAMREAESYELVVWRLDGVPAAEAAVAEGMGLEATSAPALRAKIAGAALSWTPSLDRCLEDSNRYAWVVRGLTSIGGASEWSEPLAFEVSPRPRVDGGAAGKPGTEYGTRSVAYDPVHGTIPVTAPGGGPLELRRIRPGRLTPSGGWDEVLASSVKAESPSISPFDFYYTAGLTGVGGSWGVVGFSSWGTAIYGVAGKDRINSVYISPQIGVWGEAVDGYGVLGEGWVGGVFESHKEGGAGAIAESLRDGDPALVVDSALGDDGTIASRSWKPSSDIILVSNDAVAIRLDQDKDGEDADFEIIDKDGALIFNVDESGDGWIKGALVQGSARAAKQDLEPVDTRVMLEGVAALPLYRWSYRADSGAAAHLGPMADDFQAIFALGGDPNGIATVDADGVALAAIQALVDEIEALKARVAALEAE